MRTVDYSLFKKIETIRGNFKTKCTGYLLRLFVYLTQTTKVHIDKKTNKHGQIKTVKTRSSATADVRRESAPCVKRPFKSLKVIRCCANRRGIYDFLLALSSNLTSVFNRSWYITLSLQIHTPPLLQVELEKRLGLGGPALGVRVPRTLDYLSIKCTVWSQCTPVSDRQTDGRTNIMAIAR